MKRIKIMKFLHGTKSYLAYDDKDDDPFYICLSIAKEACRFTEKIFWVTPRYSAYIEHIKSFSLRNRIIFVDCDDIYDYPGFVNLPSKNQFVIFEEAWRFVPEDLPLQLRTSLFEGENSVSFVGGIKFFGLSRPLVERCDQVLALQHSPGNIHFLDILSWHIMVCKPDIVALENFRDAKSISKFFEYAMDECDFCSGPYRYSVYLKRERRFSRNIVDLRVY